MVRVKFFRNEDDFLEGFEVKGHSGFANQGEDIVCAGVSALTQGILTGLLEVVEAEIDWHKDEGRLFCRITKDPEKRDIQVLLLTLYEALKKIALDYSDFVDIAEKGGAVKC